MMFDVAIIGAGPVGMVSALALVRRGVRVALFEMYTDVPHENRAATIHSSTLSLLDTLGLTRQVMDEGLRADLFQWRDFATGEIVAEYDFGLLGDECPWPFAVQLEQHKLVHMIEARLASEPLFTYYRATQVTGIASHADRVSLDAFGPAGEVTCEARYLIGCDGARSTVRKFMNVEYEGYTYNEKFSVVSIRHDFAASMNFRIRNYLSAADCWFGIFKVPGDDGAGIWRTTYPLLEDLSSVREDAEREVRRMYAKYLPAALDAPITQLNTYNVHQRVAARFRCGRVLLAGDAAHVNNPLGGLGLNSGIHDALNLADKLVQMLGGADDALLDLYDRQRREPAKQYVQAQSIQNKRIIEERSASARADNMRAMRETVADTAAHRAYVRRASLWQMLDDSLRIA
jgi:3-(3-hydroxy-phenyl)propionate hydroxylase